MSTISPPDYVSDPALADHAAHLRELIATSSHIVAFTGAGISAESGIPTYRGSGGLWSKYEPDKYASIQHFNIDPTYYWNFFRDIRFSTITDAKPNAGHFALAELERQGKLKSVITQNIDGLHGEAGSVNILELHGNTRRYYCLDCGKNYTIFEVAEMLEQQNPVRCAACQGIVRPATVMFGETLPEDIMPQASKESHDCDLMIVVGSSLVVYPAAEFPYYAKSTGAKLAIINVDPTPLDSMADMCTHSPAANLLAMAVWEG